MESLMLYPYDQKEYFPTQTYNPYNNTMSQVYPKWVDHDNQYIQVYHNLHTKVVFQDW